MSDDVKGQVSSFKDSLATKAIEIVHEKLPVKILELNNLYKNSPTHEAGAVESQAASKVLDASVPTNTGVKKRKIGETEGDGLQGDIPTNQKILELGKIVKAQAIELIESTNTVKIWIQLNIPRIEDGNNFGVSIQEETVNELGRAEESCFTILENMTKYYVNRAKIVSKVIKYPSIHDYRQSLIEIDEKEFLNMRLSCLDLRNNYSILYDMIQKNLEKITTPRTSHHMNTMI